jgi:hypothetical protein
MREDWGFAVKVEVVNTHDVAWLNQPLLGSRDDGSVFSVDPAYLS